MAQLTSDVVKTSANVAEEIARLIPGNDSQLNKDAMNLNDVLARFASAILDQAAKHAEDQRGRLPD